MQANSEQRAAIILAAGASTRVGSPKATARGPSGTMLQSTCRPFFAVEATPLVVTGFSALEVERLAKELGLQFVRNPAPSRGMVSSLRVGLESMVPEVKLVFVHPVDCPGVAPETLRTLLSSLQSSREALAAKPLHRGRGGHPVLLRKEACTLFRTCSEGWTLRQFLASLGSRVLQIETEDQAVVRDLDTSEDIRAWLQESARIPSPANWPTPPEGDGTP
jgi:molybdenum cofactor cytidylyltransferase